MEAWNIGVEIGGARLLDNVSLSLLSGTITCLLGPNGAGKSTLLRVLSGALAPSHGEVQFRGRPLDRWAPDELARGRAVLSQSTTLGFAFSVVEVVALGRSPHVRQSSAALDRQVIEAALAAADITHLADRRYPTLSGGEQQRVQLARVLAQLMDGSGNIGGRLLMLDEPTASLDLAHQQQVLAIARDFSRAGGTVLAVLHDLNLAASVADHVCLLKGGRFITSGRPEDVLTADMIEDVFAIRTAILDHPEQPTPLVVTLPSAHDDPSSASESRFILN
ncbi:MAG: heme ABC transporter ATP-binding protein [Pseudomonadota bacterium]